MKAYTMASPKAWKKAPRKALLTAFVILTAPTKSSMRALGKARIKAVSKESAVALRMASTRASPAGKVSLTLSDLEPIKAD